MLVKANLRKAIALSWKGDLEDSIKLLENLLDISQYQTFNETKQEIENILN